MLCSRAYDCIFVSTLRRGILVQLPLPKHMNEEKV